MKARAAAAAANGQKLRVAVTKTSKEGQAAQAASPNLMSFSSDENSIWFNGKKYGAWHVNAQSLTSSSTSDEIAAVLGEASEENLGKIRAFIGSGGIFVVMDESWQKYPTSVNFDSANKIFRLKYFKRASDASFLEVTYAFTLKDGNAWSLSKTGATVSQKDVDVFKSALGDSVQVPSTVGGIKAGTTVAQLKGKKQNEIIDMLLFPEQQPAVANPSASIALKNAFKANGIYEVGAVGPVKDDFTTGFNRGTCTVAGQSAKNRAGALDSSKSFIYVGGIMSNKTLPAKVTLYAMQYNYVVAYGQGDTLLTSWGNKASVSPNPLLAGSVASGAIYIYGTYPYYCNGASASSSAQDSSFPSAPKADTKLPLQMWTDTLVGAKFASEASTGTRLVFEFPATKQVTKVEFMNTVSGKWEVFASGNYAVSSSGNKTVQGASVAYKKLTTQGALSGALQLRFTLANASTRMMADEGLDDNMIEAVLKAPVEADGDGGAVALAADVAGDGIMPVSEDGIMAAAVDTGNRAPGVSAFEVNFEPGRQAPLDARLLVPTKADLVNAKTYSAKNYYKGMQVVVADTQEVYVLKDVSKVANPDYSGWKRIDAGAAAKTPVVDNLDSTNTLSALSANQGRVLKGLVDEKLSKTEAEGTYATKSELTSHTGNKSNPHGVTKAQVGLSNVTNDAQVKRSEVVDNYTRVRRDTSGTNVPSTGVTGKAIRLLEKSAPVVIDVWENEAKSITMESAVNKDGKIVYLHAQGKLAYLADGKYYYNWENDNADSPHRRNGESVLDLNTNHPLVDKVYIYSGDALFGVGSTAKAAGIYVGKDKDGFMSLERIATFTQVVNNLTTSDGMKALSAAQGKKLQDEKLSKTEASGTYLTKTSAEGTYAKKSDLGIVIE